MRLRARLSLTVTAVTAAALIVSFVTVYLLVRRDETRDLDHALSVQARGVAAYSREDPEQILLGRDGAHVPERLGSITSYVAIFGPNGEALASSQSFAGQVPPLEDLTGDSEVTTEGLGVNLTVQGNELRGVLIPFGSDGRVLLYATSRRTVDDDTRFIVRVLTILFVAATGITALVSRWLGERLARDVGAIASVARAVAEGDLRKRVGRDLRGSTEIRALAADLDHMIVQLEELVESQRKFISHAAHELRSPLATLRGEIQLALRRPREPGDYRRSLEDMLVDVETLARLAEDLLTLARVQSKSFLEEPEGSDGATASVFDVVDEALRMSRGPAEQRGVVLERRLEPALAQRRVRGARGELSRALRNLVDNAVAHSPVGGRVRLEVQPTHEGVRISVIDEGEGVSPADAPHIFSPFFRGSKVQAGHAEGTGLGLAIARGIARSAGGDIVLNESHKPGARFELTLVSPSR